MRHAVSEGSGTSKDVVIGRLGLRGTLAVPKAATGVVAFAHGSGSSRLSPRNRQVAGELQRTGFATLLFDLLTESEAEDRDNVFDIGLLGGRLLTATEWLLGEPGVEGLPVGYFGASTGAAAALVAAGEHPARLKAVVSRGGRPDLAGSALPKVRVPTLLIVGGYDDVVIDLNRRAMSHMTCPTTLEIVPGATHLFEEPGCLDQVVELTIDWFSRHLGAKGAGRV
jgi:putative phosphoribosyl transferase